MRQHHSHTRALQLSHRVAELLAVFVVLGGTVGGMAVGDDVSERVLDS